VNKPARGYRGSAGPNRVLKGRACRTQPRGSAGEEEYREEPRRKDHPIAALTERIPQLEPVSEPQEDPETAAATAEGVRGPLAEQKPSFWRRLFLPEARFLAAKNK
jgi:hypothetical protein